MGYARSVYEQLKSNQTVTNAQLTGQHAGRYRDLLLTEPFVR